MPDSPKILYCRCAYAQVVPDDVKNDVLRGLCASGANFETVSDLCEMSARKDPQLQQLLDGAPAKIAACYPRAVKWLFHNAGVSFPEGENEPKILNMRTESAEEIVKELVED